MTPVAVRIAVRSEPVTVKSKSAESEAVDKVPTPEGSVYQPFVPPEFVP